MKRNSYCIPESCNTNIPHQRNNLFENTNTKGDLNSKNSLKCLF